MSATSLRSVFVLAAAAGCSVAAPALANITLISDSREVFAFSRATNASQTREDGPDLVTRGAFGSRFDQGVNTAITVVGAGASAAAVQLSEFFPQEVTFQGSASASGNVSTGLSSRGEARSVVDLLVDIAGGSQVQILASTSGTGIFELRDGVTDALIFSGNGVFNRSVPAGGERLRLLARGTALVTPPPGGSDGGGYSVIFTAVPAPGSVALLGLAGVVALRRRR